METETFFAMLKSPSQTQEKDALWFAIKDLGETAEQLQVDVKMLELSMANMKTRIQILESRR